MLSAEGGRSVLSGVCPRVLLVPHTKSTFTGATNYPLHSGLFSVEGENESYFFPHRASDQQVVLHDIFGSGVVFDEANLEGKNRHIISAVHRLTPAYALTDPTPNMVIGSNDIYNSSSVGIYTPADYAQFRVGSETLFSTDLKKTYSEAGQKYWQMVYNAYVVTERMNRYAMSAILTNIAPVSIHSSPYNVQSVPAPHTHIFLLTENEAQRARALDPSNSTDAQFLREEGRYDRLYGSYYPTTRLFREIVHELFQSYSKSLFGVTFNEVTIEGFESPLHHNDIKMRDFHGKRKNSIPNRFPAGLHYDISHLNHIASLDFTRKLGMFDHVFRAIYNDFATIFINNVEDIYRVGGTLEDSPALQVLDSSQWASRAKKFIETNAQVLSEESKKKLRRMISALGKMISDDPDNLKIMMNERFSRGPSYSMSIIPYDINDLYGKQIVTMALLPRGGGAVESCGIMKLSVKQKSDPETYVALMREFHERDAYRKNIHEQYARGLQEIYGSGTEQILLRS